MKRNFRRVCLVFLSVVCVFGTGHSLAHDNHDALSLGAIHPQISPDGESIIFAYQGAIWRIPRAGGEMLRLTREEGFDNQPTWSPDGKRIAFVNGRGSHVGPLRLIEAVNGTAIKLAQQTIAKDKLAFSRDGTKLLGQFHTKGKGFALCWLDLETGTPGEKLYADSWGLRYALSLDGKTIALVTSRDTIPGQQAGNNGPQCDLWTMPAKGGKAEKLARFPGRVYDVAWNANGKALLVVSSVGGVHNDLWRVPLADPIRGMKKLTFGQADENSPSADADGRWLVYTNNRRGPTAIVVRDNRTAHESLVTVARRNFGRATGTLSLEIRDADTSEMTTARVSVRDEFGKYHAPPNSLYRMLQVGSQDLHFYCEDAARLELPAGEYQVTVARGPEYSIIRRGVTVSAGGQVDEKLKLKRWTNQRAKKWYSGESHIHANYGYGEWYNSPRTMLAQSAGEDLIVSNFMVANSESDGVFDREYFRGRPDPLSSDETILYWNQEFRSTIWGHLTLLNLKQLVEPIFTGFADTTHPHDHPTNADIADHTHDQDGHVNYTHPAHNLKDPYLSAYSAKAMPLDVALGKVDSIDVMGSNHDANMAVWYRLLNCGFRVPASAGTDCFLNRIRSRLPGQVRVYVRVDEEFTYQRWIAGLRAGRTFVTDGPMFEFQVDDQLAGSTIKLNEAGTVRVTGRVSSQHPFNQVEIVSNGEVVWTAKIEEPVKDIRIDQQVSVARTGWIAVRARGPSHPDSPTGNVFGHTGAVYVEVKGTSIDAKADAAYFVEWIDRLHTGLRQRNRIPARHLDHVEQQIAEARLVFSRLAKRP